MSSSLKKILCFNIFILGCVSNEGNNSKTEISKIEKRPPDYELISEIVHDTLNFTEGLEVFENKIFESTGAPDDDSTLISKIIISDINNQKLNSKSFNNTFREGLTIFNNSIFQLTYKEKLCYVYSLKNMTLKNVFKFNNLEGWGLTNNGKDLIMSDGTHQLFYFNPVDFSLIKKIDIKSNGIAVINLNEIEYVNGKIFANIWLTNNIVIIDSKTGIVEKKINFDDLFIKSKLEYPKSLEMNGIAYNHKDTTFFITGKLWPKIYKVKIKF